LRVFITQRAEQHGAYDGEERSVRADAERHREHDSCGEAGRLASIREAKRRSCRSALRNPDSLRGSTSLHRRRFSLPYICHIRDCMRLVTIRKDKDTLPTLKASRLFSVPLYAAIFVALCLGASGCRVSGRQPAASTSGNETIVVLRHGEKAPGGLGQLNCMGLNRALALPKMLIGRFGRASAIFAPNPAVQMRESSFSPKFYSYVRPLATIEPTAIQLGLPVNTQLGFRDIADLQSAVTAPEYANSTIFIAWEHKYAYDFARQMLRSYGLDPSQVPGWPSDDFETLYVFHIIRAAGASSPAMTFSVQQEGLEGSLSRSCPA
jgi:hypothetical protein